MIITMKQCHDLRSVLNIGCFGKFICRQTAQTVNCATILGSGRLFEMIRMATLTRVAVFDGLFQAV